MCRRSRTLKHWYREHLLGTAPRAVILNTDLLMLHVLWSKHRKCGAVGKPSPCPPICLP